MSTDARPGTAVPPKNSDLELEEFPLPAGLDAVPLAAESTEDENPAVSPAPALSQVDESEAPEEVPDNSKAPLQTDDADGLPSFGDFAFDERILRATERLGFSKPTPIQAQAIPPLLEGRSVIGRARTGSGKTAAFGLPLVEVVKDGGSGVRALVLAPTRELALQVTDSLRDFAKHLPAKVVTIYGGAPYGPQLQALRSGVSIVVGTPGRVIDHLQRGSLDLSRLELMVLDEADEMLRMGFVDAVTEIFEAAPDDQQVALFSATMPAPIRRIASRYIREPLEVQVEGSALSTKHIEQSYVVVADANKADALCRVLGTMDWDTVLIFVRTKVGCAEVVELLAAQGFSPDALHGDLNQAARENVLRRVREKRANILVATDVAARGLDVDHITHVINLSLPPDTETYVHRIGRTGRAGRKGSALSFVAPGEGRKLHHMQRALNAELKPFPVPSDTEVARHKEDALERRLCAALDGSGSERLREYARRVLAKMSPEDALAACLKLLGEARGMEFDRELDSRPPPWSLNDFPAERGGHRGAGRRGGGSFRGRKWQGRGHGGGRGYGGRDGGEHRHHDGRGPGFRKGAKPGNKFAPAKSGTWRSHPAGRDGSEPPQRHGATKGYGAGKGPGAVKGASAGKGGAPTRSMAPKKKGKRRIVG